METEDLKKFVVFKANIMDETGQKRRDGEVVELGPKLARHYGKLGFLRPYFGDDVEEDDDDEPELALSPVGEAKAKFARSRRVASESRRAAASSSDEA